jgi:hypothetical protein
MVSRDLSNVEAFLLATESIRQHTSTLSEFDALLKSRANVELRLRARIELRQLYLEMSKGLNLPDVPVNFSKRKKIAIRGLARSLACVPTEIRIYPICGVSGVSFENWTPIDLEVCTKSIVFEIFRHEVAHVLATHKFRIDCGHEELFVAAYDEVSQWMRSNGFESYMLNEYELWGVPLNSFAAHVAVARGAGWTKPIIMSSETGSGTSSSGCLVLTLAVFIISSLVFSLLL